MLYNVTSTINKKGAFLAVDVTEGNNAFSLVLNAGTKEVFTFINGEQTKPFGKEFFNARSVFKNWAMVTTVGFAKLACEMENMGRNISHNRWTKYYELGATVPMARASLINSGRYNNDKMNAVETVIRKVQRGFSSLKGLELDGKTVTALKEAFFFISGVNNDPRRPASPDEQPRYTGVVVDALEATNFIDEAHSAIEKYLDYKSEIDETISHNLAVGGRASYDTCNKLATLDLFFEGAVVKYLSDKVKVGLDTLSMLQKTEGMLASSKSFVDTLEKEMHIIADMFQRINQRSKAGRVIREAKANIDFSPAEKAKEDFSPIEKDYSPAEKEKKAESIVEVELYEDPWI